MKTLFTNEKAIAVFSCSTKEENSAIRLHVYNYGKSDWKYEYSFIIQYKNISPDCVTGVQYTHDSLIVNCLINGTTVVHEYNLATKNYKTANNPLSTSAASKSFSSFVSQSINNISSRLNLLIKMPQLNSFL